MSQEFTTYSIHSELRKTTTSYHASYKRELYVRKHVNTSITITLAKFSKVCVIHKKQWRTAYLILLKWHTIIKKEQVRCDLQIILYTFARFLM